LRLGGGNITPRESGQTSIRSFVTREPDKPCNEVRQMTAVATLAGATSHGAVDWHAIDWRKGTYCEAKGLSRVR
jgi:hypothetical protein